jgi:hypothetical protein
MAIPSFDTIDATSCEPEQGKNCCDNAFFVYLLRKSNKLYSYSVATSQIDQGADKSNVAQNKSNTTMKTIRAAGTPNF